MRHKPDTVKIARGSPMVAIRAFVLQLLATVFCPLVTAVALLHAHGLDWVGCLVLPYFIIFPWALVSQLRAFKSAFESDVPYVTMDSTGLICSLATTMARPWSQIEACACKNEEGRRVLRLFLRDRRFGEMDIFGRAETVDIDFAPAAQPKQALDQAMVACAAWIVATRDASIGESPVRGFVEKRSGWNRWRLGMTSP